MSGVYSAAHVRVCRALSLVLVLSGCGEDPPDPAPTAEPLSDVDEPGAEHAPPDPAPGQLVRMTGVVTVGGAAARVAMEIDAEAPIVVPDEGRAVVQLRDGGRIEVDGPARFLLVEDAAAQVLLLYGGLYAAQPPTGNAPRPPLRAASPAATVEIGQTGEVYLTAFEWGGSWVAVLAGAVAISAGEADNSRRLRVVDLGPGRAVAVPDRIAEPTAGPSRLSGARQAGRALAISADEREVDEAAERASLRAETDRLDQALRWLETEMRRGRDLTNGHRDAVREGNTEESQRLQRELVGHSQALYRLRHLATARWERVRAQHLRLTALGRAPSEDPVAQRRDRVAGLLEH